MFLDDLINGSRKQFQAPLADVLLFARDWGFDLADVKVPVRWWHGDADHIVPFAHGVHVVDRLPDADADRPARGEPPRRPRRRRGALRRPRGGGRPRRLTTSRPARRPRRPGPAPAS